MSNRVRALSRSVERLPIGDEALLIVAPVGDIAELEREATEEELLSIEGITSPHRRAERLSWRRALREGINEGPLRSAVGEGIIIEYEEQGAPIIKNSQYKHISVSHCRDRVAVLLSARECGVDIECRDRRFSAIAERYLSEDEYLVGERERIDHQTMRAIAWSAKEAVYKLLRREGVDLRRDMRIETISTEQQSIVVEACGERVDLRYILDGDHQIVYTIKKEDHNIE
ncbi:MAG: 4'-phosphopantetheinyl transferase superfamily protein [Alistipes sp.]|nr:4'-phosphopantetheinyl transferase superfamily protein [Alistipes sp.]